VPSVRAKVLSWVHGWVHAGSASSAARRTEARRRVGFPGLRVSAFRSPSFWSYRGGGNRLGCTSGCTPESGSSGGRKGLLRGRAGISGFRMLTHLSPYFWPLPRRAEAERVHVGCTSESASSAGRRTENRNRLAAGADCSGRLPALPGLALFPVLLRRRDPAPHSRGWKPAPHSRGRNEGPQDPGNPGTR
jgi:hypothetical protein